MKGQIGMNTSDTTHPKNEDGWLDDDPLNPDENMEGFEDLLGVVEQDVKGWLPKDGDNVFGVVAEVTEGSSEWGDYPLITIEQPSGKLVNVHCFHTVLKNNVERKIKAGKLTEGCRIAISYRGTGESSKSGQSDFHIYRVAVKPPAAVSAE